MSSRSVLCSTLFAVAATALAAPMLSATAVASAPPASATDQRPSVKTVTRSYGVGAVGQEDPDQRLRINFRGKRADLVTLVSHPVAGAEGCERTALWRVDKGRRVTQKVGDLWRLPRDGRYTMTYRQSCFRPTPNDSGEDGTYRARVQLTKVVTHALVPGGPALDLPLERGYLHAAVLTLPDERAVHVVGDTRDGVSGRYDDAWDRLLVPASMEPRTTHGDTFDSAPCQSVSPVVVQAGRRIHHSPRTADGSAVLFPVTWCDAEVTSHVSSVGDRVWFINPRTATVATAAYVD